MNVCLDLNSNLACNSTSRGFIGGWWNHLCTKDISQYPCQMPNCTAYLTVGYIKPRHLAGITDPGQKARALAGNLNSIGAGTKDKPSHDFHNDTNRIKQISRTLENIGYKVDFYDSYVQPCFCGCNNCERIEPACLFARGVRPNMTDLSISCIFE